LRNCPGFRGRVRQEAWRAGCIARAMPHLFAALCDLADLALGCKSCTLRSAGDETGRRLAGPDSRGAVVSVNSSLSTLHVGVLATPADCRALAQRLLGQRAGAHPRDTLVRGAMCELSYLLAGGVKRRLIGFGNVSVGQPSFLEGRLEPRSGWHMHEMEADLDGIALTLVCATRSDAVFAAVTKIAS